MNFYKHHLGDYAQATGHLSFVEDAAYSRLLRKYYAEEKPIPGDLKAAQRLVGARTRDEKEAVQTVLEEFFDLDTSTNVWRNKRADEEIAEAQESQDEAEERRKYEADRKRRYRERRSQLFDQLRDLGIVPSFDTAMDELERMLSRGTGTGTSTGQVRGQVRGRPENGTANQTPDSRHQTPEEQKPRADARSAKSRGSRLPPDWTPDAELIAWAKAERPGISLPTEAAKFRDYWIAKPGQQGLKLDWTATFRNWIRSARDGPPTPQSGTAATSKTMQALQNLEGMKNGTGLDHSRNQLRLPAADLAEP